MGPESMQTDNVPPADSGTQNTSPVEGASQALHVGSEIVQPTVITVPTLSVLQKTFKCSKLARPPFLETVRIPHHDYVFVVIGTLLKTNEDILLGKDERSNLFVRIRSRTSGDLKGGNPHALFGVNSNLYAKFHYPFNILPAWLCPPEELQGTVGVLLEFVLVAQGIMNPDELTVGYRYPKRRLFTMVSSGQSFKIDHIYRYDPAEISDKDWQLKHPVEYKVEAATLHKLTNYCLDFTRHCHPLWLEQKDWKHYLDYIMDNEKPDIHVFEWDMACRCKRALQQAGLRCEPDTIEQLIELKRASVRDGKELNVRDFQVLDVRKTKKFFETVICSNKPLHEGTNDANTSVHIEAERDESDHDNEYDFLLPESLRRVVEHYQEGTEGISKRISVKLINGPPAHMPSFLRFCDRVCLHRGAFIPRIHILTYISSMN